LRRDPRNADARYNRGSAFGALKRQDEALADFREAARLKAGFLQAIGQVRHLQTQMCAWADMIDLPGPFEPNGYGRGFPPFMMATMLDDPARQQACARAWIAQNNRPVPLRPFPPPERAERLRVGYFSADFEDHATMVLMAGMLEKHDRSRFEVHAYSYGKPCDDDARRRTVAAVEHFHDLARASDAAIVDLARTHQLDLAIDLKGFTHDSRYDLFLHRLAPVQMSYLGYPGTMGAPFIDYIIADKVVLPPKAAKFYDEKVIWLPGSYQANDDRRAISERTFTRAELGLPERGFVFCCFNNSYKITPVEFDIWMRLLGKIEGSVLWLLKSTDRAEANLRREAEARGIDPERLVFAPRMPLPDHLARHAQADLFLDTFVCNAHTTASDALWAGLPVLTRPGKSFAARVAASLVHAVGLPELAVKSDAAYEAMALELATDPVRLAAIRKKLAASRLTAPLFETERTTRNIERAYELAFERYLAGEEPDHIEL
jgi:predicted O-linked N-acetylglucosamine transferase (SPINDLY family)